MKFTRGFSSFHAMRLMRLFIEQCLQYFPTPEISSFQMVLYTPYYHPPDSLPTYMQLGGTTLTAILAFYVIPKIVSFYYGELMHPSSTPTLGPVRGGGRLVLGAMSRLVFTMRKQGFEQSIFGVFFEVGKNTSISWGFFVLLACILHENFQCIQYLDSLWSSSSSLSLAFALNAWKTNLFATALVHNKQIRRITSLFIVGPGAAIALSLSGVSRETIFALGLSGVISTVIGARALFGDMVSIVDGMFKLGQGKLASELMMGITTSSFEVPLALPNLKDNLMRVSFVVAMLKKIEAVLHGNEQCYFPKCSISSISSHVAMVKITLCIHEVFKL